MTLGSKASHSFTQPCKLTSFIDDEDDEWYITIKAIANQFTKWKLLVFVDVTVVSWRSVASDPIAKCRKLKLNENRKWWIWACVCLCFDGMCEHKHYNRVLFEVTKTLAIHVWWKQEKPIKVLLCFSRSSHTRATIQYTATFQKRWVANSHFILLCKILFKQQNPQERSIFRFRSILSYSRFWMQTHAHRAYWWMKSLLSQQLGCCLRGWLQFSLRKFETSHNIKRIVLWHATHTHA